MRGKEADGIVQSVANLAAPSRSPGIALPERRFLVEITDADYRSIFLPCEALEENKERPGGAPGRGSTRKA